MKSIRLFIMISKHNFKQLRNRSNIIRQPKQFSVMTKDLSSKKLDFFNLEETWRRRWKILLYENWKSESTVNVQNEKLGPSFSLQRELQLLPIFNFTRIILTRKFLIWTRKIGIGPIMIASDNITIFVSPYKGQ